MKEVFEKIIEKLDSHINMMKDNAEKYDYDKGSVEAYQNAKRIVQKEAAEQNNGWISCSERLPDVKQRCLIQYNGKMSDYKDYMDKGCYRMAANTGTI